MGNVWRVAIYAPKNPNFTRKDGSLKALPLSQQG
jgi:hypothetical protein